MNNFIPIFLDKKIAKKLLIDLAIYSTVLDIIVFFSTISSFILKTDLSKVLLPINIGITLVISAIIILWSYIKLSELSLILKSKLKRNLELSVKERLIFINKKFSKKIEIKLKFFSYETSIII